MPDVPYAVGTSRRTKASFVVGIVFAIALAAAIGARRPAARLPSFVPSDALVFVDRIPSRFGGGSVRTYTWKADFTAVQRRARRELLAQGWSETAFGDVESQFTGKGSLTVCAGVAERIDRAGARTKDQATLPTSTMKGGVVSVVWFQEDGSAWDGVRQWAFERFGIGR